MAQKVIDAATGKPKDTYKYQFKVGNKVVYGGITNDLERSEKEHRQEWPSGHIKQVGQRTTVEAAREWEKDQVYGVYGHARKYTRSKRLKGIFRSQAS
ncbi:MAG: hypothetical protein IIA73_02095 [Proteobacteria bacterium]|nr:hypothetical protein [Pseudomonadota bacterium]